jgi:hypothetical protein
MSTLSHSSCKRKALGCAGALCGGCKALVKKGFQGVCEGFWEYSSKGYGIGVHCGEWFCSTFIEVLRKVAGKELAKKIIYRLFKDPSGLISSILVKFCEEMFEEMAKKNRQMSW